MNKKTIRIATRGSKLALYQAYKVKDELEKKNPDLNIEVEIIKTKGDIILDVALSKIGDKGLFTKELEVSLLNKETDLAVHSLKDLPTSFVSGLKLGGVLERAETRDALVAVNGKKLNELDETDVIATSSLRRKAQLLHINPNFKIVDIRGNVETRLRKMQEGYCTAMIMASAGLMRLGYDAHITEIISTENMLPAVSQGAIAIEIRDNDPFIQSVIDTINHTSTLLAVAAERTFMNTLEGGCQVPIGCFTETTETDFAIEGFVSDLTGQKVIRGKLAGKLSDANEIAATLAKDFISKGALDLIDGIRKENGI